GLAVGARRYQAKSLIGLPSPLKKGENRLSPCVPLRRRRHRVGRVLFEESHEALQIKPLPGLHITVEEFLLRGTWARWHGRPAVRITFGKRIARSLQGAVD